MVRVLRRREVPAPDAAAVAQTVLRLAVLLQAGIAPRRAWVYLAGAGDEAAAEVVRAAGDDDPADAIAGRGGAWRELSAAWRVAVTVGAPLADSLRGIASALRDAQEASDDVRTALAEPASTSRLMAWLPLVAVALGVLLGFDVVGALFGSPLGAVCLVTGIGLVGAARWWTGRLVQRARPAPGIPGLECELFAIALSGGVSIERATAIVAECRVAADAETADVLRLSRTAGIPAVELLRASADLARHRARTEGRLAAASLSSRLLVPLGVCTLPAFLLLGVAPMLLSVLSATPLSP